MKKKDMQLVAILGVFLLIGMFLNMPVVHADINPNVNLTVLDATPEIKGIGASFSEDTESCTTTTISAQWMNVSDGNGWEDINLSACYINYTYGATTYQADTCVNVSNGTSWVNISCTGAVFNYTDQAGVWNITFYAEDDGGNSVTNHTATTNLTYNSGIFINISDTTITWGSITAGVYDTINSNSPDLYIENCGNTILNINWTGADVTGSGHTLAISNFRLDNTTGASSIYNMTLTTSPQRYTPFDNLAIGGTDNFYVKVDIPSGTFATTYDTTTWTITPSEA